jgi:hypothetical protein
MDWTCAEPGCTAEHAIACEEPRDWMEAAVDAALDEPAVTYYCPDHAEQNGFCRGCGLFCAGIETYDFGRGRNGPAGFCEHCQDQIEDDMADEAESDDWEDPL